jgi:holin-like protein
MNTLKELGLILAFGFAGEILAFLFPIGVPASVLGLFLMLLFLGLRILKPEHLGKTADYLSANMAFFFLPAVASVLNNFAEIKGQVLKLLGICVFCTFFTFAVTYGTVRLFQIILKKRS